MTWKASKQIRAHQKQLDILSATCLVYELRCLCLQHEMQDLEEKVDYVSQLSDVDKAKVDYTSQLLDDVLSSILSRMTIKDAVKTNIFSIRWRYLVASMLTLQFSLDMIGVNYLGPTCQPYY
ncbi:putative F-box/LRR-repeat protein [Capsicum baccatum]|uniref:F-box/LRR-repeat protein n=1 Tax=Capsicum baccatum TaxID=33114 RepID=A0A2G2V6B8_CAPBA|nr:putative F-box/LRR-repeat protein [Capsicum baccatum]